MAASLSTNRISPKEQSTLTVHALEDPQIQQALSVLCRVFQSSYGPKGKLKYLHNNCGGHVTVTSCSGRILHTLSVKKPVIKLVTTSIQEHLKLNADGGHLAGLLCLLLVNSTCKVCPQLHRRLVAEIYELLLGWCMDLLNQPTSECKCIKHTVDFSQDQDLVTLVSSVVGSKPGCLLFGAEKEHIIRLLVEVFLKTFTVSDTIGISSTLDSVRFISFEGSSPVQSAIEEGLFIESPQIPVYRKKDIYVKRSATLANKGLVSTALFNVSLSGDSEDFVDAVYELGESCSLESVVLKQIAGCVDWLVENDVGLLACQKVVHPSIKQLLKEKEVLCIDRLGLTNAKIFCRITGCQTFSVLEPSLLRTSDLGYLSTVDHRVINDKSYIHLQGPTSANSVVCTVMLHHWSEEALQEIQYTCETALQCLEQASRTGVCLAGGGCWQTWLAYSIHSKAAEFATAAIEELGCTQVQFQQAADVFVSCLEKTAISLTTGDGTALRDDKQFHLWVAPSDCTLPENAHCQCGAYPVDDSMKFTLLSTEKYSVKNLGQSHDHCMSMPQNYNMLDSFLPAVSAVRTAVSVANMIISIYQYIHDDN